MQTLYHTNVTDIGELVPTFIEAGMLVFFGEGAPEELRDFCIMHKVEHQEGVIRKGDFIEINEMHLEILSLGHVANENLMNLGHLNLKANGQLEAELPGDVCVAQTELPEITIGSTFRIYRRQ